ncbi:ribosome biogenesis GTPase YlqF [Latilactobacillus sakei]|uniref:Ribosome biogenesis GTPase A n=2 Tax=Latilactobacillus sakei TaxID=1599 RepID=A0A9N7IY30_LATSK|nr:ribosome biogenesis GTPase YlqF [Latilactobacillus sakei]ARJ71222.1 ribosome biogenesis GTPase YlqF [Latilactobacillus sakei]AST83574.1 ribosome biogenesis GTPase YlqF [Latilactobacillus sakei]AWZ43332.1 ribosome biogenesis GTPase YlqF [Latilactobacillus sakei]AWZ44245.1 ribosome biogenesis GTPase YlqF [Latilactobacillus sakei]AWZ45535.1 ribosome biogenesis GTPase YlqF [Latilactobacillus sakei]
MTIQWYPGHMAKAQKQIKERLKAVDLILEIVDARVPESSINPMIQELGQNKPILLIMNKADMADPRRTQQWIETFKKRGITAIALDAQHKAKLPMIEKVAQEILAEKLAKKRGKGIRNPVIRAMCVGVPNVGKSTILNRLVQKNIAVTGNRPGVTKNQQWLKAGQTLELLDTPGVLWPKFEDPTIGSKLALTGAISDAIYHPDDVVIFALEHFKEYYPSQLQKVYKVTDAELEEPAAELIMILTKRLGFKEDYDRFCVKFINDARQGKLGRFTLDVVPVEAS